MTSSHHPLTDRRLVAPLLIVGLAVAGCAGTSSSTGASPSTSASTSASVSVSPAAPQGVKLSDVLQDPSRYRGQLITVTGTAQALAPFVLALTPAAASDASSTSPTTSTSPSVSILPTSPSASQTPSVTVSGTVGPIGRLVVIHSRQLQVSDGATVTVSGTLQVPFDVTPVQRRFGITVNEQAIAAMGDAHAALVAESVTVTAPAESGSASSSAPAGSPSLMSPGPSAGS